MRIYYVDIPVSKLKINILKRHINKHYLGDFSEQVYKSGIQYPIILSDKLDNYKVECITCGSKNIIEKQNKIANFDVFTIKLDCSDINEGTNSWYENDSSSSGDGHPRKF